MTVSLPEAFIRNIRRDIPGDADALFSVLDGTPPVSVRWNPYKTQSPAEGIPVAWCRYGRYLPERPSFTTDPLFHAGAYYVQEASSMFVEHLLRSTTEPEGARILDLCAAPGGKATLYSTLAGGDGIVIANEVIRNRALILADNIRKWGIGNTMVTNNDPAHFAGLGEWFDAVAVDAPCSGEGMFRKSPEARGEWSEANVRLCAARQRRIVSDAWAALRPGGVLIYSTCTFNRTEDEENVRWIAEELGGEDAGAMVPPDWGIEEREAGGVRCFRLWPHRIAGEGFFAAAIRKGGQRGRPLRPKPRKTLLAEASRSETAELSRWVGQPDLMHFARIGDSLYGYYATPFADIRSAAEYLNTLHSGICMGQMFGGRLKPDHSLAMFHDLARSAAAETPLSSDEALHYLRREDFAPQAEAAEGMNLMTFEGYALGWAKRIGNRFNNLYPKSQMILNK